MYRDLSPKERYFEKLINRNSENKTELRAINKRSDMIKQLQDKLTAVKTKTGRGGSLTNEKNVSQIRCRDRNQLKPYPNVIKARHMMLSLDREEVLDDAANVKTPKIKASEQGRQKMISAFTGKTNHKDKSGKNSAILKKQQTSVEAVDSRNQID